MTPEQLQIIQTALDEIVKQLKAISDEVERELAKAPPAV